MLESIQVVGGSVLTLFLMMAVGFFLGKRQMLTTQTLSQLSKLLLYIVCPAIMIDTFLAEEYSGETIHRFLIAAAALAGTYVLSMLLIQLCFRRAPEADRGVMRFASIYGNTSFMGIPLIMAVIGQEGMLVTVTSLAVFTLCTWSHGLALIGGREYLSVKKILLNPGIIGFFIAIAVFFLHVQLPGPAAQALTYVGQLNTPLAMIVIGAQMSAVHLPSIFRNGRLYLICVIKLLVFPLITMLVLLPFHLDPITFQSIAILGACPVAGATGLFSQIAGRDTSLAAGLVTLSTLLCIITLPLVSLVSQLLNGG